ncbi:MAG: hypothetical protein JO366_14280 [Methylobacteriaceae bacterium]|nr:hypothetical protein [Methylobacteriaceae bacterium]
MRLRLIIDSGLAYVWHRRLADRLKREGHEVAIATVVRSSGDERLHRAVKIARMIERHLYRIPSDHPTALLDAEAVVALGAQAVEGQADCTIDLAGAGAPGPVIAPRFDGSREDMAAVATIIDGRAPVIEIAYRGAADTVDRVIARGRPAIEDRAILTRALDQMAVGALRLLLQSIRRISAGEPPIETAASQPPVLASRSPFRHVANALAAKIAARLTGLLTYPDHWRIGWRWTKGDAVGDGLVWPQQPYRFLADDRQRYFADPFAFVHDGAAHVFCEEFPYATRRGIISMFTVTREGVASPPRPILERPYHLSYPLVFAEGGAIWMIPESSENRTVELYRAQRFPDVWVREAVLVENVVAADATLVTHGGRRWLFAAVSEDGSSSWDALGLFHALDLFGPWTAHPLNPLLIDVEAARPAGMMFTRQGRLLRPAQDCTNGYGSALTLCEVTRLDPHGYEQRIVRRLPPPASWKAHGVHTLNGAGGLEVIDCVGARRRF